MICKRIFYEHQCKMKKVGFGRIISGQNTALHEGFVQFKELKVYTGIENIFMC
jgi:hypothetical protein